MLPNLAALALPAPAPTGMPKRSREGGDNPARDIFEAMAQAGRKKLKEDEQVFARKKQARENAYNRWYANADNFEESEEYKKLKELDPGFFVRDSHDPSKMVLDKSFYESARAFMLE